MKKFLLTVAAVLGLVTGLTLTSCGGGGGGGGAAANLSGITISANGPASTYRVRLVERQKGTAYSALIMDGAGRNVSQMTVNVIDVRMASQDKGADIVYLEGSAAPDSLEPSDNNTFYQILSGIVSTNNAITQLWFPEPMSFVFDGDKQTIHWKGKIAFKAIAANVEQEVEEEIDRIDSILYVERI